MARNFWMNLIVVLATALVAADRSAAQGQSPLRLPFEPDLRPVPSLSRESATTAKPRVLPLWTTTGTYAGPRIDTTRFPEEREVLALQADAFPNLGTTYEVLAPSTGAQPKAGVKVYNCVAWAIGVKDQWVWPHQPNMAATVADFDDLYSQYGYIRLPTRDLRVLPGTEKVILYGKFNSKGMLEPTHAAKQEATGMYSSKLGGLSLIRHATPEAVSGPSYGDPIAVYFRFRSGK